MNKINLQLILSQQCYLVVIMVTEVLSYIGTITDAFNWLARLLLVILPPMERLANKQDDDESEKHVIWRELGVLHLEKTTKMVAIYLFFQIFNALV